MLQQAVEVGFANADVRYGQYLLDALARVRSGEDAASALGAVENAAQSNLEGAEARRNDLVVAVATPISDHHSPQAR